MILRCFELKVAQFLHVYIQKRRQGDYILLSHINLPPRRFQLKSLQFCHFPANKPKKEE